MNEIKQERICVLVKTLPMPCQEYGETIRCVGMTWHGGLKWLYPVRFRYLDKEVRFKRWDWIQFNYERSKGSSREEICFADEWSLKIDGRLLPRQRSPFLNRSISDLTLNKKIPTSIYEAIKSRRSLALIRPKNSHFHYKKRTLDEIREERRLREKALTQNLISGRQLIPFKPCPYEFYIQFEDTRGEHNLICRDWESHSRYMSTRRTKRSEEAALDVISTKLNKGYPKQGMLLCVGNMDRHTQTWEVLGILKVAKPPHPDVQWSLF